MKRIGMLTSGGDCQGLNSTLRGVAKALYEEYGKEVEIYGFKDGYKGLIQGEYRLMSSSDFSGILTIGGTILGTSRQPFKNMRDKDENGVDKVTKMIQTYNDMKLDCLVILGGNGTTKTANLLREEGTHAADCCLNTAAGILQLAAGPDQQNAVVRLEDGIFLVVSVGTPAAKLQAALHEALGESRRTFGITLSRRGEFTVSLSSADWGEAGSWDLMVALAEQRLSGC